jgi:hypothetical protein
VSILSRLSLEVKEISAKSERKPGGVRAVSDCKLLWKWKPSLVDKPIEIKSARECE